MQYNDFCFWLHGYSEITNRRLPNATEWAVICDHLDLVFSKVTPERYTTSDRLAITPSSPLSAEGRIYPQNPTALGIPYSDLSGTIPMGVGSQYGEKIPTGEKLYTHFVGYSC